MFIKQKSNFTSAAFSKDSTADCHVMASGAGTFRIEVRGRGGDFQQFPELTFTAPTAQVLSLPRGELRVVVLTGPIDVEVTA